MSFAERAQKVALDSPKTAVVHVDGLVVLKIVKHCRDSLPQMVAGSLLGLDQGSTLEAIVEPKGGFSTRGVPCTAACAARGASGASAPGLSTSVRTGQADRLAPAGALGETDETGETDEAA